MALELHNTQNLKPFQFSCCFVKGKNGLYECYRHCIMGLSHLMYLIHIWFLTQVYLQEAHEVTGSEQNGPSASSMQLAWNSHSGLFSMRCSSNRLLEQGGWCGERENTTAWKGHLSSELVWKHVSGKPSYLKVNSQLGWEFTCAQV